LHLLRDVEGILAQEDDRGMPGGCGIQIRMFEGRFQRSIASHGSAGDGPVVPSLSDAISRLDMQYQVLNQIVFILPRAVEVVRIKAVVSLGTDEDEFRNFLLLDHLLEFLLKTAVPANGPAGMVVVQSMQKVDYRIVPLLFSVGGRKEDTVLL